jgi:hypothetical protein
MASGEPEEKRMIELKSDELTFSFPECHEEAVLTVSFQRTLRIPDDGEDYPLPPGLGRFPLRHIDDYAGRLPATWLKRGGVLLPMWQSEALWLRFHCRYLSCRLTNYPFAVKVATGKISAITGKRWSRGLSRSPQDYLVVPVQPWLDGYCVEQGVIRQFVAMPLGRGYSVEEQLTGKAEFGGLQLEVSPMRKDVFEKRFPETAYRIETVQRAYCMAPDQMMMGLAPGGRMRQEVYRDPYSIRDWDIERSRRCFVHLVNSVTWQRITGAKPPSEPLTALQYTEAGYPWFDYYDAEAEALAGAKILTRVKSVKAKREQEGEPPLPDNESLATPNVVRLRAGLHPHQVREATFD